MHGKSSEPEISKLKRTLAIGAMVATLALLGGCKALFASNCNKPQIYEQAQSLPPLRIPAGLDAPDTRTAMRIPDLKEPEAPRGVKDSCLETPPPFTPPAAGK
jgi:uncharacterized lipoprotein